MLGFGGVTKASLIVFLHLMGECIKRHCRFSQLRVWPFSLPNKETSNKKQLNFVLKLLNKSETMRWRKLADVTLTRLRDASRYLSVQYHKIWGVLKEFEDQQPMSLGKFIILDAKIITKDYFDWKVIFLHWYHIQLSQKIQLLVIKYG